MFRNENPIPISKRRKELLIDYVVISVYLVVLLCVSLATYYLLFHGVPRFHEIQSQLITFFTSVFPVVLIFSYFDYFKEGSVGKLKSGLKLIYDDKSKKNALIRNCVKFLPWQMAHMGVIHGMYTDFDSISVGLCIFSVMLALGLCGMTFFRKDKRHLGDLLAGTQVQVNERICGAND